MSLFPEESESVSILFFIFFPSGSKAPLHQRLNLHSLVDSTPVKLNGELLSLEE